MMRHRLHLGALTLALVAWACGEPSPAAPTAEQDRVNAVAATNEAIDDCFEATTVEHHDAGHDDADGHHDDGSDAGHDDADGHHDDDDGEMAGMSAEEHAAMEDTGHDDADGHHDDADDGHHDDAEDPCADVVDSLAKGPVDRVIKVDLRGLRFKPNLLVIQPGETVRFEITNSWLDEHEFRLTNAADAEAHITGGHQHAHEIVKGFHTEGTDLLALIQPGETIALDVTFDGSLPWSIVACMIPGHYEEGMWAEIHVLETTL
jgi:uncharacterized cupredoxin-like copper-binding protein